MRENGIQIQICLERFEDSLLADETSVSVIESKKAGGGRTCLDFPDILSMTNEIGTDAEESDLNHEGLESWLRVPHWLLYNCS